MHLVDRHTAIHEAGHAVAHVRLRIFCGTVTIKARKTDTHIVKGSAEAEDGVWNEKDAKEQILACCAGYAALIAAGYDENSSRNGCGGDFEKASDLIDRWQLGTLDDWLSQSVDMMRQVSNVQATTMVADHLMRHETLDSDYIDVLITVADGETSIDEFEQYLIFRNSTQPVASIQYDPAGESNT